MAGVRVCESAVVPTALDTLWAQIRSLDFCRLNLGGVTGSETGEGESPFKVGSTRRVTFDHGGVWFVRLLELSDSAHLLSWEVYRAEPATAFTSRIDSLQLRPVSLAAAPGRS